MKQRYDEYEPEKKELAGFLGITYVMGVLILMLFYNSIPIALAGGLLVINLIPVYKKYKLKHIRKVLERQFKDFLDSVSASVAAGRKMNAALQEAEDSLLLIYDKETPLCKELQFINESIRSNRSDTAQLLEDLAQRSGIEDIKSFATVFSLSRKLGGNMEEVIEKTNKALSEKIEIMREIETVTSQKKFEVRIITAMPIVVIGGLNLFYPEYLACLYTTLAGRMVMTLALAGMVLAYVVMQKMMDIEV